MRGVPAIMLALLASTLILTGAGAETAPTPYDPGTLPSILPAETADPAAVLAVTAQVQDEALRRAKAALRAATLAAGAFPIAYLYTNFAFDLGVFAASGGDARYAPWPFSGTDAITPSTEERTLRILVAAGISLVLGIADGLIR